MQHRVFVVTSKSHLDKQLITKETAIDKVNRLLVQEQSVVFGKSNSRVDPHKVLGHKGYKSGDPPGLWSKLCL